MDNATTCPNCGRSIPGQLGPNPRCPACRTALPPRAPLAAASAMSSSSTNVTVRRTLAPTAAGGSLPHQSGLDPTGTPSPRPLRTPSRPGLAAAEPPAVRRQPSESSVAAARLANAPTFKSSRSGGGLSLIPIVAGVVLTLGITVFALTRGRSSPPPPVAPRAGIPQVTTIGRPPPPETSAVAEPEPPPPVVTRDLPGDLPAAPAERRAAAPPEPVARPVRPAPPREVARAEKPPATTRATPAAPIPAPPPAPAAARVEPDPPAPPPQFVAVPLPPPPSASAPLTVSPSGARDGYQKARQARPGCVNGSLRLPRDIPGVEGETAMIKFQVDESGAVSDFIYLSGPTDQRVANAIWSAVQRCEWIPGSSAQGRPLTLWVTMPIRFGK